jgi:hypothetical protein
MVFGSVPAKMTDAPGATVSDDAGTPAQEWTAGRFAAGAICPETRRAMFTSSISPFWQASQMAWPFVPTGRLNGPEETLVIWT